jgi:signal transduction histidine kinase
VLLIGSVPTDSDPPIADVAVSVHPDSERSIPSAAPQVWIVDDSPLEAELCRRVLAPEFVAVVYDGGSAMLEDLARKTPPQVLVLDWYMPALSGIEICEFVRKTRDVAQLPILILTATQSSESLLEAMAAGANDFVRKPFSEAELKARVETLARTASLHARLVEAERRLRVEAEFRERFMGMLAHDLRQPLNAITMACHSLSNQVTAAASAGVLALQLRAAGRMQRMIAELLDFTRSRPEHGMPIQRQPVDLEQIVRSSLDEIRLVNAETVLELSVEGSCRGSWDPDRLAQICSNLFGNAIEHAPRGSPVQVTLVARDSAVELAVRNSGSIPEEVLATLFQPYRQRRRAQRPGGGVGLGLHIVEQIVRAHGGTVAVSRESSTTRFLVTLPRE